MIDYNNYEEHTWIATIVGAHGIKGAVRASYVTDTPDYYLKEKALFLEKAGSLSALNIIRINQSKNYWIILFVSTFSSNTTWGTSGTRKAELPLLTSYTLFAPVSRKSVIFPKIRHF